MLQYFLLDKNPTQNFIIDRFHKTTIKMWRFHFLHTLHITAIYVYNIQKYILHWVEIDSLSSVLLFQYNGKKNSTL